MWWKRSKQHVAVTNNNKSTGARCYKIGQFYKNYNSRSSNLFEKITFSDIVKTLEFPSLPQTKKEYQAIVILAFAAQTDGLTAEKFEFLQTSKWAISLSVTDLASASKNFTLPISNKVTLIAIQEAMFKVLEKKFLTSELKKLQKN